MAATTGDASAALVSVRRLKSGVRRALADSERLRRHPAVQRAFPAAWLSNPDENDESEADEPDDAVRAYLQSLASCLAHRELLVVLVKHLRPFMLELTVRLLDPAAVLFEQVDCEQYIECDDLFKRHEMIAAALAPLLTFVPSVFPVVQQFFASAPCFFEYVSVEKVQHRDRIARLRRIASTADRLLRLYPHELAHQWNWSAFFPLCFHDDTTVRWHAARATAVILHLGSAQRTEFLEQLGVSERDAVSGGASSTAVRQIELQEHLLSVNLEEQRIGVSVYDPLDDDVEITSTACARAVPFHQSLKNIFGVIVPTNKRGNTAESDAAAQHDALVPTASTQRNLQAIAIALGLKRPVLVSGSGGTGKTAAIRELARLSGNSDLVELHLDDQIDSKTLLGSYVCTEIPGEFTWQPGALTTAILSGRWVVIEDIDRAPFEVLAALMPLLETREMILPGRGERLVAHPNFQIFGTTTHGHNMPKGFQESIWTAIDIQAMEDSEIQQVLHARFEKIPAQVIHKIMVTYNVVCGKDQSLDASSSGMTHVWRETRRNYGRDFCLRDLLKWGKRIGSFCFSGQNEQDGNREYITEEARLRILMEAFDIFCAGIRDVATRLQAAIAIGTIWEVHEEKIRYFLEQNKPHVSFNLHEVEFGRVHLPTLPNSEQMDDVRVDGSVVMTGHVLRLLERLAAIVYTCEPALLIGETGCGKTTIIQHLAKAMGQQLVVQNLNIQSDSSDLVGGFKPVEIHLLARPLYLVFIDLFSATFSQKSNASFLNIIRMAFERKEWKKMVKGMRKAVQMASTKFQGEDRREHGAGTVSSSDKKKSSAGSASPSILASRWDIFESELDRFERQKEQAESHFAFSFVEGVLVKALREGHWVLLDEINLASSDTLERISTLLEHETSAFSLTERGDVEIIRPHPNFRIFGAMNPSTDVGKKDLPPSLRNRFTEIYVDECVSPTDLQMVVQHQFKEIAGAPVAETVEFYLEARKQAEERLSDGARHKPRYSLRTLSRALVITRILIQRGYGLPRALYEGFASSFCTQLEIDSRAYLERLIKNTFAKNMKAKELVRTPPRPGGRVGSEDFMLVSSYWIRKGEFMEPRDDSVPDPVTSRRKFVLTKSVEENLRHVSRAALIGRYPVLLQGPTSAGKTSLISYLAARIGQKCVRINNHEHTDIQEYLGSYVSDSDGKLSFKEGVLVEAVRNGWWIILDELNLAPSEVLEALNRLLDDNRELFLPETQEVVKPHPKFMLFATQNPPGLYGGRKVLSRAFRNRFMEIQVDEVGTAELQTIVQERSSLPPSYCSILIEIMRQLQLIRQQSSIFAGKAGFITTRDLLRWAERRPMTKQALAEEGYCLLAERLRKDEEKALVKQVIEDKCRVTIDLDALYYSGKPRASNLLNENGETEEETVWGTAEQFERVQQLIEAALGEAGGEKIEGNAAGLEKISVTKSLRRLFALVGRCLQHEEPVLLVGETGCGKTTVCQLYSLLFNQPLHIINCHQHTETSDFLGCLRPVRGKETIQHDLQTALTEYFSLIRGDDEMVQDQSLTALLAEFEKVKETSRTNDDESLDELRMKIEGLKRRFQSIFEWSDGPLVESMKNGDLILIDEVNLAEDAVLERLNSVLEPSRTLLLAEKGGDSVEEIVAHSRWRVMATMNPGGDFGKRELSPALRNRFTEIWVPAISDLTDIATIIQDRLVKQSIRPAMPVVAPGVSLSPLCDPMLEFVKTFNAANGGVGGCGMVTLRDILSWINFITSVANNKSAEQTTDPWTAFVQGAALAILDGLGLGSDKALQTSLKARDDAYKVLLELVPENDQGVKEAVLASLTPMNHTATSDSIHDLSSENSSGRFGIGPFSIPQGPARVQKKSTFSLKAPTTLSNLYRVLRAMQVNRPIILEGSPGVGKTSLISALAAASGHRLVRINLSEQTDISDLFGSDLPAASSTDSAESSGMFEWCDGVFLRALKAGDWVLLDELNLASQSVLEGLNSCLDHRGTVYIPELDREFECPRTFRVFAAQNPLRQGGGRKGLPKSFLNRFTRVFVDTLHEQDLIHIAASVFPSLHHVDTVSQTPQPSLLERMIRFNTAVHQDTMVACRYGRLGSPWEFNLRDVFRFCELLKQQELLTCVDADHQLYALSYYVNFIYVRRMRSAHDREMISRRFEEFFGIRPTDLRRVALRVSSEQVQVGNAFLKRRASLRFDGVVPPVFDFLLNPMEALAHCVNMGWPALLVGPPASGKTSSVRLLAALTGNTLHELGMSAGTDATELLGCFEQVDVNRKLREVKSKLEHIYENVMQILVLRGAQASAARTKESAKSMKTAKHLSTTWWTLAKRENYANDSQSKRASKSELDEVTVDLLKELVRTMKRCLEESDELFGTLVSLDRQLDAVVQLSKSHSIASRFEWVDGTLIQAMEKGEWILLDNVNFCSSSVLDRLNSLLETGGELLINECGVINGHLRVVHPHPNFRIFLAMDSQYGEVSRAMRNRCIEIALLGDEQQPVDAMRLSLSSGIPGRALCQAFQIVHSRVCDKILELAGVSVSSRINRRHLENWSLLAAAEMNRGVSPLHAIGETFQRIYGDQLLQQLELEELALKVFQQALQYSSSSASKQRLLCARESVFELCQTPRAVQLSRDLMYVEYLVESLTAGQVGDDIDVLLDCLSGVEFANEVVSPSLSGWRKVLALRSGEPKSVGFAAILNEARSHLIAPPALSLDDSRGNMNVAATVALFALRRLLKSALTSGSDDGQMTEDRLLFSLEKLAERVKGNEPAKSLTTVLPRFLGTIVKNDNYSNVSRQMEGAVQKLTELIPSDGYALPLFFTANHAVYTRVNAEIDAEMARNPANRAALENVWASIRESQSRLELLGGIEWLRFCELDEFHHIDTLMGTKKRGRQSIKANVQDLGSFSVLQQSYAIHVYQFDRADLENDIIVLIYPFIQAFDEFIREFLVSDEFSASMSLGMDVEALLRNRFEFSVQLRTRSMDWMRFLVHWQWVRKSLLRFGAALKTVSAKNPSWTALWLNVRDMAGRIDESVSTTIGGTVGKSVLWKNGGHALLPRSRELWQAHALLERLSSSFMEVSQVFPPGSGGVGGGSNGCVDVLALLFGGVGAMEAAMKSGQLDISSLFFVDASARQEVLQALCAFSYLTQEQLKVKEPAGGNSPVMVAEELYKLPSVLLTKLKEKQQEVTALISKQMLYLSEIEDNGQSFVDFLSAEDSRIGKDAPILLFDMKENAQLVDELVKFQLSPLMEQSLAREEVAVLSQLLRVINAYDLNQQSLPEAAFVNEITQVLRSLEALVDGLSRLKLRDPASYFAYKDLIWCGHKFTVGDENATLDIAAEIRRFVELAKTHMNTALFGFHRFLRHNSFNQIDQISMTIYDTQRMRRKMSKPITLSNDEEDHSFVASGYPRLFQSVQSAVVMKCIAEVDLENSTCANVETQVRSIRLEQLKEHFTSAQDVAADEVGVATEMFIKELFVATIVPFETTFDSPDIWSKIIGILSQITSSSVGSTSLATSTANELVALLKQSQDATFAGSIDEFVVPLAAIIAGGTGSASQGVDRKAATKCGEALLILGLWRFALLAPQSPVDPVTKPIIKKEVLLNRLAMLTMEDAVDVATRRLNPLPSRSPEWRESRVAEMGRLSNDIAQVSANAIQRFHFRSRSDDNVEPVPMSAYGDLFRDLRRFQSTIMPTTKLLALLSLSRGTAKSSLKIRDMLRELNLFQQASDNFAQQMAHKYQSAFRDVVEPVIAAVFAVKEGVALITWSLYQELQERTVAESHKRELTLSLVHFPSPISLQPHTIDSTWRGIQLMLGTIGSPASSIVFGGARNRRNGELALLNVALARLELMFRSQMLEIVPASSMENAMACSKALFDLFLSKWQEQKEKEEQRRKEEEELFKYKVRNLEIETEEQLEEQEFREQFPDYNASDFSAFLTADLSASGTMTSPESSVMNANVMITDKMMQHLCLAHLKLFAEAVNSRVEISKADIVSAFSKAFSLASTMHQTVNTLTSSDVETAVISSGIFAASLVQSRLGYTRGAKPTGAPGVQSLNSEYVRDIDFHRDPFVKEAVLVNEPLHRLLVKLQSLLALWPDHAILQQLVLIADRIRNFEISSPLARTLTGIELLLRKAQEWEAYAARDYSIATELNALSALVTRWRKLELYSWPHLLHVKEKQHQATAQKTWLNLYALLTGEFEHDASSSNDQAVIATSATASADLIWLHLTGFSSWLFGVPPTGAGAGVNEKKDEWFKSLFETLDAYLRSCPLGQFETRLLILYSFCAQFFMEFWNASATSESAKQSRYALGNALYHLYRFYAQHLGFVGRQWSGLKAPIQRKLVEFVKIARWDEQTYYSLAESAEKSHRKLMKFVRDYDAVLNVSMQTVIDSSTDSGISKDGGFAGILATRTELAGLNDEVVVVPDSQEQSGEGEDGGVESTATPVSEARQDAPIVLRFVDVIVNENEHAMVDDSLIEQSQFAGKLPTLSKRIAKFTRKIILSPAQVEARQEPRQVCEDLCESIFYRMGKLQKGTGLPKGAKKKALIDLLSEMKDQGMVYHRMQLPAQLQQMERLFELDVPDVESCIQLDGLEELVPGAESLLNEVAGKKSKKKKSKSKQHSAEAARQASGSSPLWLWERADGYYYRFLGQLGALRFSASTSFSHDLSMSEVDRMSGYAENMLHSMLQQRQVLHATSLHHQQLVDGLEVFARLKKFKANYVNSDTSLGLDHIVEWHSQQMAAVAALRMPLRELEVVVWNVLETARSPDASTIRGEVSSQLREVMEHYNQIDKALSASRGLHRSHGAPAVPERPIQQPGDSVDTLAGDASLMAFAQPSNRVYGLSPVVVSAEPTQLSNLVIPADVSVLRSNGMHFAKIQALLVDISADFARVAPSKCFDGIIDTCARIVSTDHALANQSSLKIDGDKRSMTTDTPPKALADFVDCYDKLVETVLVSIQDLTKSAQRETSDDQPQDGDEERHQQRSLREQLSELNAAVKQSRLNQISAHLVAVLDRLASQFSQLVETRDPQWQRVFVDSMTLLEQFEPSLLDVRGISRQLLVDYLVAHKSVMKLDFVLVRIFRNLFQHGFCRTEDKETDGEAGDGKMQFTDDVEGTGMGEGEGKKDVSHEIEDEEQLLGLQGEQQEQQNPPDDQKPEDTGMEMQNDFEGTMQDVPEDEKNENDEKDDDDEEELDREMGEFNQDDENVVDEKMWGEDSDDDEDKIDKDKEKFEEDSKVEGEAIEDEIRGKDGDDEEKKEDDKNKKEKGDDDKQPPSQPDQAVDDGDGDADDEDDGQDDKEEGVNDDFEDKYEDNHDLDPQNREDGQEDEVQQDEEGDLPDDMQLDKDGGDDGDEDGPDGDDNDVASDQEMDAPDDESDNGGENGGEENEEKKDEEDETMEEPLDSAVQMGGGGLEDEPEPAEEDPTEENPDDANVEEAADEEQSAPSSAVAGTQSKDGKDELEPDEMDEEKADEAMEDESAAREEETKDPEQSSSRRAQQQSRDNSDQSQEWRRQSEVAPNEAAQQEQEKRRQRSEPNPYRNPQNAQEHWRKRVEMIERENKNDGGEKPKQQRNEDSEMAAAEFVDDDDEDMDDVEHALAPADENQVMNQTTGDEEKEKEEDTEAEDKDHGDGNGATAMEIDDENEPPKKDKSDDLSNEQNEPVKREHSNEQQVKQEAVNSDDKQSAEGEEQPAKSDEAMGDDDDEVEDALPTQIRQLEIESKPLELEDDTELGGREVALLSPEEVAALRDELDAFIARWSADSESSARGADLWAKYTALTAPAAQRLCEQLRLVLEPMLRAKLEGDFRTGKRINMRKVIPYIASQFRKDKIWMRRTRPSKRAYQIMVAIDDSESMADNHAGRLALEAMSTLCKGMTQLEVGELCVAKFGERLELLHAFDAPFTDDAGGRVLAQFGFQQQKTNMVQTLDAILQVLETAKQTSSAASANSAVEFTQIVFLISDGRFDSDGRARIRKLVETALERQQLIVLLIVDQAGEANKQTSIVETKSVTFNKGKVEMVPYLDRYPFPYYVLLPTSTLLPEVLADSLRQWFEMLQMKR